MACAPSLHIGVGAIFFVREDIGERGYENGAGYPFFGSFMLIRFDGIDFLVGVAVLFLLLAILWHHKHSVPYLIFFSIFWAYLLVVVSIVIFPIGINLDSSGTAFAPRIILNPFYANYCPILRDCLLDVVGNILLTIPFGFGLSFLLKLNPRHVPWIAIALGLAFELSQLAISFAFRTAFRSVDINDAILNAAGVLVGYGLFHGFAWAYLRVAAHFDIQRRWFLADIYVVARQTVSYPNHPQMQPPPTSPR